MFAWKSVTHFSEKQITSGNRESKGKFCLYVKNLTYLHIFLIIIELLGCWIPRHLVCFVRKLVRLVTVRIRSWALKRWANNFTFSNYRKDTHTGGSECVKVRELGSTCETRGFWRCGEKLKFLLGAGNNTGFISTSSNRSDLWW